MVSFLWWFFYGYLGGALGPGRCHHDKLGFMAMKQALICIDGVELNKQTWGLAPALCFTRGLEWMARLFVVNWSVQDESVDSVAKSDISRDGPPRNVGPQGRRAAGPRRGQKGSKSHSVDVRWVCLMMVYIGILTYGGFHKWGYPIPGHKGQSHRSKWMIWD